MFPSLLYLKKIREREKSLELDDVEGLSFFPLSADNLTRSDNFLDQNISDGRLFIVGHGFEDGHFRKEIPVHVSFLEEDEE